MPSLDAHTLATSSALRSRSGAEAENIRILEHIYEVTPSVGEIPAAKAVIEQEMPQAVARGDLAGLHKLLGRLRAIINLSSTATDGRMQWYSG